MLPHKRDRGFDDLARAIVIGRVLEAMCAGGVNHQCDRRISLDGGVEKRLHPGVQGGNPVMARPHDEHRRHGGGVGIDLRSRRKHRELVGLHELGMRLCIANIEHRIKRDQATHRGKLLADVPTEKRPAT